MTSCSWKLNESVVVVEGEGAGVLLTSSLVRSMVGNESCEGGWGLGLGDWVRFGRLFRAS